MISTIAIDASIEKIFLSHRRQGMVEYLEHAYNRHPYLVTSRVRRVCLKKIMEVRQKIVDKRFSISKSLVALLPFPTDVAQKIDFFVHGDISWNDDSCLEIMKNQAMKLPMPLNGVAVTIIFRSLGSTIPLAGRSRRHIRGQESTRTVPVA